MGSKQHVQSTDEQGTAHRDSAVEKQGNTPLGTSANTDAIDVSIVLAIYNVEKFLDQCLRSLEEQTLKTIEIICVNDGSTDSSQAIIERHQQHDSRIKLISKQNSGYGDSMNQGIAAAHGRYIGIVEPDDWVSRHMFETLLRAAKKHHFPDIVKGAYTRVINADTPDETQVPAIYYQRIDLVDTPFTLSENAQLLLHHPSIWSALYKRSFLRDNSIAFQPIPGAGWADNPFLMETFVQAKSIVYIDEMLYFYREFNTGSSSVVKDPRIIFERWLDMDAILKKHHVTAKNILEAHYARGCAYIQMLADDFPGNELAKSGIRRMMKHIDYNTVLESNAIIQPFKDAYQAQVSPLARAWYKVKRRLA